MDRIDRFLLYTSIILLCFCTEAFTNPWTPIAWQEDGKLRNWVRDQNANYVDDWIETQTTAMTVIIDLNQCLGPLNQNSLIQYLNTKGDVSYVGKYLSFVVVTGIEPHEALDIATRPEVAMVEHNVPLKWLGMERQAMKVEASAAYPNNLSKKGWPKTLNGSGINIAILDSGVDNNHSELKGRFKYGYNALTQKVEDPTDDAGHGTFMARFALGNGNLGIAPAAGLIDIKIGGKAGGTVAVLLQALEEVINKRKQWSIDIVSLSTGYDLAPPYDKNDGQEAVSWMINRVAAAGIVVMAAAGNGTDQGDKEIKPPGTASWAITVGAAAVGNTVNRSNDQIVSTPGPRTDDGDQDQMDELKPELTCSSNSNGRSSVATAQVSGLAALILQKSPDINPGSLKDLLIRTAEDIDPTVNTAIAYPKSKPSWDKKWGFGLVDAYLAIHQLEQANTIDLTFQGFDGSAHPSTPWYLSKAIKITRGGKDIDSIVSNQLHKITARLLNNASQDAENVRISFAFYEFTAGISTFYDIGSVIQKKIAKSSTTDVSIDWTPPKLDGNKQHGCLHVSIEYGLDATFSNKSNFAQRNLRVARTASPAKFNFFVENPMAGSAQINLRTTSERADWKITLSDTICNLQQHDCPILIEATTLPPPTAKKGEENIFYVTAYLTAPGVDDPIDIGGVALKATVGDQAKQIPTWMIIFLVAFLLLMLVTALMSKRTKE